MGAGRRRGVRSERAGRGGVSSSADTLTRQRWLAAALGAIAAGIAAGIWFVSRPAAPVLIGTRPIPLSVPPDYQVSVFPAFGAWAATLALDAARGGPAWRARALLLVATSALAVLRLLALIPVSGHALFAGAVLGHELCAPRAQRTPLALSLAAVCLAWTAWYKLVVWGDPGWFAASTLGGAALGLALARRKRCARS